jgi:hypothetical protein
MIRIKLASGIAFLVLIMLAVACGAPQQESDMLGTPLAQDTQGVTQTQPTDPPPGDNGNAGNDRGEQDMPGTTPPSGQPPERVPEETPLVTGEVPEEVLNPIMADVTERAGAEPAEIEVARSQSVTWNDGSLGCPKPGMFYTQALVDGYWVVLSYQGQEFDYRVNDRGAFFLCEKPTLPGIGLPGGGNPDNPVN